jgi:hypothetical protein
MDLQIIKGRTSASVKDDQYNNLVVQKIFIYQNLFLNSFVGVYLIL